MPFDINAFYGLEQTEEDKEKERLRKLGILEGKQQKRLGISRLPEGFELDFIDFDEVAKQEEQQKLNDAGRITDKGNHAGFESDVTTSTLLGKDIEDPNRKLQLEKQAGNTNDLRSESDQIKENFQEAELEGNIDKLGNFDEEGNNLDYKEEISDLENFTNRVARGIPELSNDLAKSYFTSADYMSDLINGDPVGTEQFGRDWNEQKMSQFNTLLDEVLPTKDPEAFTVL